MKNTTETAVLVFRAGGQLCALRARCVREIVPLAELAHVAGQPSVIEGFLTLRGEAVPVIGLQRLFDLAPGEPGLYAHVIILHGRPHPVGLLVERVVSLASPKPADWLPLAGNTSFNQCAEAELRTPDGIAQFLSCERLLLEREKQCVEQLQARAQRYLTELEAPRP